MNKSQWKNHISNRPDCTEYITHLTRRKPNKRTIEILYDIIDSKCVLGSGREGYITEGPAACFQDVPLEALANNIVFEENDNFSERVNFCNATEWQYDLSDIPPQYRYEAFGIRVHKIDAYKKGARPVIYGDKRLFISLLNKDQHWRLVDMNLEDDEHLIDWSHEREWRIKGNYQFELNEIELIVGCEQAKKELIEHYRCNGVEIEDKVRKIIVLKKF